MWSFSTISRQETRGKSKLADFFPNAGDAESLVRESLQNALDAKSDQDKSSPVSIRISVGRQKRSQSDWVFDKFDAHVAAVRDQTKRTFPITVPDDFAFVLIEDFNTLGFDGTFDNEDQDGRGSLVSFWWEEGESEKPKGGGGSHGVGKVTLSEASQSGLFFAHSIREEDSDEILFGYCRIGMHNHEGKRHREYGRFGISEGDNSDESMLRPYSVMHGGADETNAIKKFKEVFGVDRTHPGASILIPNIDTDLVNRTRIIDAVLGNFYLPIMKGLLRVEVIDQHDNEKTTLDTNTFLEFSKKARKEDDKFLATLDLASVLIQPTGFYSSTTDFDFSRNSRRVCSDVFAEDRLVEMRSEYAQGKPVKVKLNVHLFPADGSKENGFMHIAVSRRKNRAEDPQFYDVFRGDINVQDEKLGTAKANGILDVFGAHDEDTPNPLSEFMKYCEDPGHKHWNGAINRRNEPLHFKRNETWQKQLARTAVRDLIQILENDDEKKLGDFADDIFFFATHVEADSSSTQKDDDGVEDESKKNDVVKPPVPPDIPKNLPLVSISKLANGVRIKATKKLRDAMEGGLNVPPLETVFCYEMFGASKAAWVRYGGIDIDLSDSSTFSIDSEHADYDQMSSNRLAITPSRPDFCISVKGFDPNRQLYVNVKDREVSKAIAGGAE